jgi:hypothetical protein
MDEILVCMYLGKNTGILTGSYTLVNHISSYGTFRYPSLNVLPQKILKSDREQSVERQRFTRVEYQQLKNVAFKASF